MTHTTISLRVTESSCETIEVERLATDRVRLLESPLVSDPPIYLGDIIEIEPAADGQYAVTRVLEATHRHNSWVVPAKWPASADASSYFAAISDAGGMHELLAGGLLMVHVPVGSAFDPDVELSRYLDSTWPTA